LVTAYEKLEVLEKANKNSSINYNFKLSTIAKDLNAMTHSL